MLELYITTFGDAYTPERQTRLIELVKILMEAGYDDELTKIYGYISQTDTLEDAAYRAQENIFDCTYSLLSKLSVGYPRDEITHNLTDVVELVSALLYKIEEHEDYNSLLAIVDSGENNVTILTNLVVFVSGREIHNYFDTIESVSDKLITVIRSNLMASQLDNDDEPLDPKAAARVSKFIKLFPTNAATNVLSDYGYLLPEEMLVDSIDVPDEGDTYLQDVALASAGIAVAKNDTYPDALKAMERTCELLLASYMYEKLPIVTRAAMDAIKVIFDKVSEDEIVDVEDEVDDDGELYG
jgi:hypothetical protein